MCTDEAVTFADENRVATETTSPNEVVTCSPVTLNSLLKDESVAELLAAKKIVEGLLAERIQQEIDAMRANAAAISEATQQPIEQVVESLLSKTAQWARKLTVVEVPKQERVKYRHPENPELTWSGRGKQPGWLRAALERYDEQELLAA